MTGKTEKIGSLELSTRLTVAADLHRQLNQAVAETDLGTVKDIACTGLSLKIRQRVETRRSRQLPPESWILVKYKGSLLYEWMIWPFSYVVPNRAIRAVSDRVAPLPVGGRDATIRQTIVRIKSLQRYNKGDGDGMRLATLTEYVVIQKMFGDGMDTKWMIWGTVQPSTKEEIEDILEMEQLQAGNGFWDKVKNLMPMGGGGGGGMVG